MPLRHRKSSAVVDGQTESEPLIQHNRDSREVTVRENGVYTAFVELVKKLWFYLLPAVGSVHQCIMATLDRLTTRASPSASAPTLSIQDEYRHQLQTFGKAALQPYDKTNAAHEQMLLKYWRLCRPNEFLTDRVSSQWKQLGFQGTDPATDVRGAGILGLQCLLFFAENYASAFARCLEGRNKTGESQELYPFSISGFNLVVMLFEMLGLVRVMKAHVVPPAAQRALMCMLFSPLPKGRQGAFLIPTRGRFTPGQQGLLTAPPATEDPPSPAALSAPVEDGSDEAFQLHVKAFGEVFVMACLLLELEWFSRPTVGYFDFPSVIEATFTRLAAKLEEVDDLEDVKAFNCAFNTDT